MSPPVPAPRAVAPCARLLAWLGVRALPLLLAACATTTAANLGPECAQGRGDSCSQWGQQLLQEGERQQAENAFGRSCELGVTGDCTLQGQLMLDRGEVASAEAPLRKGYDAEDKQATLALMGLYQSRGEPGDEERVRQLSWDIPAIDKPDREVMFWWRPSITGRSSYALAYTFQPMLFWSRRMALGFHFAGDSRGAIEFNGSVGYQHYLTPEIVPYGTLLIGAAFQERSANVGVETGVKLCLGPVAHLNLGGGISVGSPFHASIGLGINSLPVDLLLYIAAHLH
ncbi:hypothetical protein [Hyalangium versicolor]|uniref:hypothetical protein n=1 Tax=Hyalangium versicolor TaxID=2861190 RepID=UPI001CCD8CF5|nr:hypothetical protein [Hyalangium versicolor]